MDHAPRSKRFFLPWLLFHLRAIFSLVGALGAVWCFPERKIKHFLGIYEEPADQMVIQLDVVASNPENRGTGRSVGQWVFRLDAVAAIYCTTGKQSTGWPKISTGWDKQSTGSVNNVFRGLFRGLFKARVVQLFKVDLMT